MTTLFISHSSKDKAWAERAHQALTAGGYQCLFLDSHPDDGIHAGADWEQTLYQRLRQSRGVVVLCSANWLASPWCVAEAMMARERKRRVFLLATADIADGRQVKRPDGTDAPRIPDFLKDRQFISLSGISEDEAWQRLLDGLGKEGLNKRDFKLPARPYPGLEPFTEEDGAIFFGRDEEIDRVIDVLHRRRKGDAKGFVVLLGASGCGKSSLVRAGVLPQLKNASKSGSGAWVIVPPFTGGRGLDGLALSLADAFKDAGKPQGFAALRGRLGAAEDVRRLGYELLDAGGATDGAVLLVLDQLEEVFGTPEGSDARAALRLLLEASAETFGPVVVLATMRSDFLNDFQLFEGAAKRYEEVPLDPMLRSHFSEVIEGPAAVFGLDLDPGLTERMVEDAAYADALPLLAYTLRRLYETYGADGKLELADYETLFPPVPLHGSATKVRGVAAAIKISADEILNRTGYAKNGGPLPDDDPRMRDLRSAFYRLAQVGEEGQFTRRTVRWSQMPGSCKHVLQRFVDQRLLVSGAMKVKVEEGGEQEKTEPSLSVAHEALFRVWDTLNGWLHLDRKALALRAQIEEAAAEWQAHGRTQSRAWPDERILGSARELGLSGVLVDDLAADETSLVYAFMGPTNRAKLQNIIGLSEDAGEDGGTGRYGKTWRLPLSHEARASVGRRLAVLVDQRSGVGVKDSLPDIDWVVIKGDFTTIEIRSHPNEPEASVYEEREKYVSSFRIGRYPVTVDQFRAIANSCYRTGRWRIDDGRVRDALARFPPPTHRNRYGNYPADRVNWCLAEAFCRWLTAAVGFNVRLPTEAEWQLAAVGPPALGNIYPWGPEWDVDNHPWLANTAESGLEECTSVGLYPAGASCNGVMDMAGTLWEWCANAFDDPDTIGPPEHGKDMRVIRGGTWNRTREYARCTYRKASSRTA